MSKNNPIIIESEDLIKSIEIRQHNAITNSRNEMNSCEMDLFFSVLSKLSPQDDTKKTYNIYVNELSRATGRKFNHTQFKEATKSLIGKVYEIPKLDNKSGKINYIQTGLIASAEYVTGEGCIKIEISQAIRPYLYELKNNFTSYSLQSAFLLSSKYAKRFYQIFSQWKDIGVKTIKIEDIKYMFMLKDPKGIEPEQYEKYSSFKKYVLDISIEQINKHTDLNVSFTANKKGRNFVSITFLINIQQPKQLPIIFDNVEPTNYTEKQLTALKTLKEYSIIDTKIIKQIINDENLMKNLAKWKYDFKHQKYGTVKSPSGHLLKTIGLTSTKPIKKAKG